MRTIIFIFAFLVAGASELLAIPTPIWSFDGATEYASTEVRNGIGTDPGTTVVAESNAYVRRMVDEEWIGPVLTSTKVAQYSAAGRIAIGCYDDPVDANDWVFAYTGTILYELKLHTDATMVASATVGDWSTGKSELPVIEAEYLETGSQTYTLGPKGIKVVSNGTRLLLWMGQNYAVADATHTEHICKKFSATFVPSTGAMSNWVKEQEYTTGYPGDPSAIAVMGNSIAWGTYMSGGTTAAHLDALIPTQYVYWSDDAGVTWKSQALNSDGFGRMVHGVSFGADNLTLYVSHGDFNNAAGNTTPLIKLTRTSTSAGSWTATNVWTNRQMTNDLTWFGGRLYSGFHNPGLCGPVGSITSYNPVTGTSNMNVRFPQSNANVGYDYGGYTYVNSFANLGYALAAGPTTYTVGHDEPVAEELHGVVVSADGYHWTQAYWNGTHKDQVATPYRKGLDPIVGTLTNGGVIWVVGQDKCDDGATWYGTDDRVAAVPMPQVRSTKSFVAQKAFTNILSSDVYITRLGDTLTHAGNGLSYQYPSTTKANFSIDTGGNGYHGAANCLKYETSDYFATPATLAAGGYTVTSTTQIDKTGAFNSHWVGLSLKFWGGGVGTTPVLKTVSTANANTITWSVAVSGLDDTAYWDAAFANPYIWTEAATHAAGTRILEDNDRLSRQCWARYITGDDDDFYRLVRLYNTWDTVAGTITAGVTGATGAAVGYNWSRVVDNFKCTAHNTGSLYYNFSVNCNAAATDFEYNNKISGIYLDSLTGIKDFYRWYSYSLLPPGVDDISNSVASEYVSLPMTGLGNSWTIAFAWKPLEGYRNFNEDIPIAAIRGIGANIDIYWNSGTKSIQAYDGTTTVTSANTYYFRHFDQINFVVTQNAGNIADLCMWDVENGYVTLDISSLADPGITEELLLGTQLNTSTQVTWITPASPGEADIYTLSIGANTVHYDADATPTVAEAVTGLTTAWNNSVDAGFVDGTAVDDTTHVTITADLAGTGFGPVRTSVTDTAPVTSPTLTNLTYRSNATPRSLFGCGRYSLIRAWNSVLSAADIKEAMSTAGLMRSENSLQFRRPVNYGNP